MSNKRGTHPNTRHRESDKTQIRYCGQPKNKGRKQEIRTRGKGIIELSSLRSSAGGGE